MTLTLPPQAQAAPTTPPQTIASKESLALYRRKIDFLTTTVWHTLQMADSRLPHLHKFDQDPSYKTWLEDCLADAERHYTKGAPMPDDGYDCFEDVEAMAGYFRPEEFGEVEEAEWRGLPLTERVVEIVRMGEAAVGGVWEGRDQRWA